MNLDELVKKPAEPTHDSLFTDVYVAPTLLYLQGLVRKAFVTTDQYHGLTHAQDVEKNVFTICSQPDITVSNLDKLIVRAAALLHDVGYAAYEPGWSKDRREHVQAGLDLVISQLRNTPIFAENPDLNDWVSYLIAYHDDTNYNYPSAVRGGEVTPVVLGDHARRLREFEQKLTDAERERLNRLLCILREADAMAATNTAGAHRTFNYSVDRGLPVFSEGNPLNAWCWEESAIGNVRVGAKRMLIDSISGQGKRFAREHYNAVEIFVESMCSQHRVPYMSETPPVTPIARVSDPQFKITRYQGWTTLEAMLREVAVLGDSNVRPYASATIKPRKVAIRDLRPASYYALRSQIAGHHHMATSLQSEYAFSIFDLTGILDYTQDGTRFRMAPPLVETYHEPTENQTVSVIVDGLHRVLLARQFGIESIWVMEVSDISPQYPLVPLPLNWDDVELCNSVPPTHAKRKFRFPTLADFPNVSALSDVEITDGNYLYFFYRDLSSLGSDGVRSSS
jgi:hypothetical protein